MTSGRDGAPPRPAVLVIIPARGGSKGIPRKNLRSLGGRPLIAYAIGLSAASRHAPDVYVSSDDAEILSLSEKLGANTHRRLTRLARDATTLDAVVSAAYPEICALSGRRYDVIATVQPTSPLLQTASLDAAIDRLLGDETLDTILSAVEDAHLRWTHRDGEFLPLYAERINRQQLEPVYRETGGLILCRERVLATGSRIGSRVSLHVLSGAEAIDIDTPDDWALCEWYLARRDVLMVVAGNAEIGLGHAYNMLAVANELVRHRIRFLVTHGSTLARDLIAAHHYEVSEQQGFDLIDEVLASSADVIINDRLDTPAAEIERLKAEGRTVISFEDLGDGAALADLVINAIYPERTALPNHHYGPRFFCLRPEFLLTEPRPVTARVKRVLLTFGGVDPNDLTRKVVDAIAPECRARGIELAVVAGRGYRHAAELSAATGVRVEQAVANMADHIRAADLVFTSAGRTIFEVASLGTPAIVLAQNARELTHFFASPDHGFVNLGLGTEVAPDAILTAFRALADDADARRRAHARMLDNELRNGTQRVVSLIEATIGGPWPSLRT